MLSRTAQQLVVSTRSVWHLSKLGDCARAIVYGHAGFHVRSVYINAHEFEFQGVWGMLKEDGGGASSPRAAERGREKGRHLVTRDTAVKDLLSPKCSRPSSVLDALSWDPTQRNLTSSQNIENS